jgi:hypothetical protein
MTLLWKWYLIEEMNLLLQKEVRRMISRLIPCLLRFRMSEKIRLIVRIIIRISKKYPKI